MKLRLTSDGTWYDDELEHEVGNHIVLEEIERLRTQLAAAEADVCRKRHLLEVDAEVMSSTMIRLDNCRILLREAYDNWTEKALVIASEDGKTSHFPCQSDVRYGVAIVGIDWHGRAKKEVGNE